MVGLEASFVRLVVTLKSRPESCEKCLTLNYCNTVALSYYHSTIEFIPLSETKLMSYNYNVLTLGHERIKKSSPAAANSAVTASTFITPGIITAVATTTKGQNQKVQYDMFYRAQNRGQEMISKQMHSLLTSM